MLVGLLFSLIQIFLMLITIYTWLIIIQSLLSWVNPDPYNPIVQLLYKIVYPAYYLVSKLPFRTNIGSIDLAPMIIILALLFLKVFIESTLIRAIL